MIGWSVELSEFGLHYEPKGSVKGQHLADFAVELVRGEKEENGWKLFVDGSSCKNGGGAGIVLEGSDGVIIEQSIIFKFQINNNQAEYEALIAGMELASDMGITQMECRTDSQVVVEHMNGGFQVKDDQLLQYYHKAKNLQARFRTVNIKHVPRSENTRADMLSKLASGEEKGHLNTVIRQTLLQPTISCFSVLPGQDDWRIGIVRLIKEQDGGRHLRVDEAKQVVRYCIIGEELYRRGYATTLMKSLSVDEADYVIRELHEGICGRHTGGRALKARVLRA